MPQLNGSVTPSVAAAATAASMAFPPWLRMASADADAFSLIVATAPPVPVAMGVLASASGGARTMDRISPQARALADVVMAGEGSGESFAHVCGDPERDGNDVARPRRAGRARRRDRGRVEHDPGAVQCLGRGHRLV